MHRFNTGQVPLTFVYQAYSRIRKSSLNENLFRIAADNIGIEDVPGRTVSPYNQHVFYGFAPFADTISQFNAITFSLPQLLWQMPGISSVQIDFADGKGFRALAAGSTASVYYEIEGMKTISARITAGGNTRTAKAQFYYRRPKFFVKPDHSIKITATPVYTSESQYLGTTAVASDYNCNTGSFDERIQCMLELGAQVQVINGCDGVFDKPVIIVEGFDPKGELDFIELRKRFTEHKFITSLQAAGYDVVFVDFFKNGDYIENNAKVLEKVLDWVNQTKVGSHRSTVIGFSMGGLISRWCLKDMEDRNLEHQVENYFSYDSPHQGANVPLGMQYLFQQIERDLGYFRFHPTFKKVSNANKSPAARQMLVTKAMGFINNTPTYPIDPLRVEFAKKLVAKGYPARTKNYGLAFGRGDNQTGTKLAGNGTQWNNFTSGTKIYEGNLTWAYANFLSDAYASPVNGNTQLITKWRFIGWATYSVFDLFTVTAPAVVYRDIHYTGFNPYDEAPGGYETTQRDFAQEFSGVVNGASGIPKTFGHDAHNHMSTVSALDLQNQAYTASTYWQSTKLYFPIDNYIINRSEPNGNTLSDPSLSPFRAVITASSNYALNNAELENGWHNGFIIQPFSKFIIGHIFNYYPTEDCLSDSFCRLNPTIQGSGIICNTASYTISNLPNGVNIKWTSATGKSWVTGGQGTSSASFSTKSSGSETIVATITSVCGASKSIKLNVWIGPPANPKNSPLYVNGFWGVNPITLTGGGLYDIYMHPVDGARSYRWELSDGLRLHYPTNTYVSQIWVPDANGTYTVYCYPLNV